MTHRLSEPGTVPGSPAERDVRVGDAFQPSDGRPGWGYSLALAEGRQLGGHHRSGPLRGTPSAVPGLPTDLTGSVDAMSGPGGGLTERKRPRANGHQLDRGNDVIGCR